MTKKGKIELLICECKLWLHMPELTDAERLRRISNNLDAIKKLLSIPKKTYTVFNEK